MPETNTNLHLDVEAAAALGNLAWATLISNLTSSAGANAQLAAAGSATELEHISSVQAVEAMRATVTKMVSQAEANSQAQFVQAQAERERRNGYADAAMGVAVLGAATGNLSLADAEKLIKAAQTVKGG